MMNDAVREMIVGVLSAVPDIGRVHGFERYADQLKTLLQFYQADDGQLRGWFVRRLAVSEVCADEYALQYVESVDWQIRGYMALADGEASELRFDALIDAIREAFRTHDTLAGTVASVRIDETVGVRLEDSGPVMFAGVLCHAATLKLSTRRYRA